MIWLLYQRSKERVLKSIQRTTKWAEESLSLSQKIIKQEGLYRISKYICPLFQGGVDKEFRKISALELV